MTTTNNLKKKKVKTINVADLFCGAGGTSSGLMKAAEALGLDVSLLAINHWDIAIATHSKNHEKAQHRCQSIDSLNPLELIPGGRLKLLLASPECVGHSNARGGKPTTDQKRADAWLLMRWIEKLFIENIIIENVKEFENWGPLRADGKPDKRHLGTYFRQFIETLKINYNVEYRVLNAADYGDATTRERLFIIARRPKGKKIVWPEPSHTSRKILEKKQPSLLNSRELKPWRAAREIIDWSLEGKSIFGRSKPLSENTLKRIYAGLFKYSLKPYLIQFFGERAGQTPRTKDIKDPLWTVTAQGRMALIEPYLINLKGKNLNDRSINDPSFAQTANGNHQCLVEPFLLNYKASGRQMRDIDDPTFTQCSEIHQYLVQPFLVKYFGTGENANSVDEPVSTLTAKDRLALVEPFFFNLEHNGKDVSKEKHEGYCYETERPLPTVAGKGMFGLIEPFIVSYHSGQKDGGINRSHSLDEPIPTLDTSNRYAVAEPFIIPCNHGKGDTRSHSINDPMKTITGVDAWGMVEPFLVKFNTNNTDGAHSINEPLGTITGKDRFGLCIPQLGAILDIRFRMLQPHELAAAMGFPKSYSFVGNREAKVKQIGNAVAVNLAKALCESVLIN
jgi:DNA (cytosine-5)-methyltransferase 1